MAKSPRCVCNVYLYLVFRDRRARLSTYEASARTLVSSWMYRLDACKYQFSEKNTHTQMYVPEKQYS